MTAMPQALPVTRSHCNFWYFNSYRCYLHLKTVKRQSFDNVTKFIGKWKQNNTIKGSHVDLQLIMFLDYSSFTFQSNLGRRMTNLVSFNFVEKGPFLYKWFFGSFQNQWQSVNTILKIANLARNTQRLSFYQISSMADSKFLCKWLLS